MIFFASTWRLKKSSSKSFFLFCLFMPLHGNVLFENIPQNLTDFTMADKIYIRGTGAFHFDNIIAEDANLFLLRQAYKSPLFISETMDVFVGQAVTCKPSSQHIWLKALTPTKRKATGTAPAQDHGDPSKPDNLQDWACGLARKRASALAAGCLN